MSSNDFTVVERKARQPKVNDNFLNGIQSFSSMFRGENPICIYHIYDNCKGCDNKHLNDTKLIKNLSYILGNPTGTKNITAFDLQTYVTSGLTDYYVTGGTYSSGSKQASSSTHKQSGSGYTSDPSEFIGGRPVVKSYDDNSPPAIINGSLIFGSPDQPVCGPGAVSGGARNLNKGSKKNKINNKNKNKSKKNKKSKKQIGGEFTTFNGSKPSEYSTAFNGEPGYFKYPDNMSARTFTGRQPNWNVTEV